jgi:outer membrane protein with beta-barrel domain
MRVLSGVFVVVLLCGSPARAQGISWGVKGGVNLATLNADEEPAPDFGYRVGLVAGGFVTWRLSTRFDVQPEVLFSQQGASIGDDIVDAAIEIDSLVVPILARYRLRPSGGGLVLFAGPSLGFKLRAKAVAEVGGEKIKTDIGDDIEDFDYGVVFGAGWEVGPFSIDGRYTWGLSRIGVDEVTNQKTTHRVIAVLAGVRF